MGKEGQKRIKYRMRKQLEEKIKKVKETGKKCDRRDKVQK